VGRSSQDFIPKTLGRFSLGFGEQRQRGGVVQAGDAANDETED